MVGSVKLCSTSSSKLSRSKISNVRNSTGKKIVTIACAENSRVQRSPSSSITAAAAAGLGALVYSSPALAASEAASTLDGAMAGLAIGGVVVGAGITAVFMQQADSSSSASAAVAAAAATPVSPTPVSPTPVKIEDASAQQKSAEAMAKLESEKKEALQKKDEAISSLKIAEAKIKELEQSLTSKEAELERRLLTESAAQAELKRAQEMAASANKELAAAIAKAAAAEEKIAELEKATSDNAARDEELTKGRMEREKLKFKVIDAERAASEAVVAARGAAQDQQRLQTELSTAREELTTLKTELEKLKKHTTAVEDQLAAKDSQIEAAFGDQNELMRRLEGEQAQVAQLETTLAATHEDAEAAKSLVRMEREKLSTIEAARAAAVEDARKLLAERRDLTSDVEEAKSALKEEKMLRIAAEKALESTRTQVEHLVTELAAAQGEIATANAAHAQVKKQLTEVETDASLAAKDAKEAVHKELELMADLEKLIESNEALKVELENAKRATAEVEAKLASENALPSVDAEVAAPAPKRRGRPKKKVEPTEESTPTSTSSTQGGATIEMGPLGLSDDEVTKRLSAADAATAAAQEAAKEAKQRSYEIRAEAALLVETVEDRAVEAVEAAQLEVKKLKAELKRVTGRSDLD
jgi:chromosome segregation ATPase